jgi:hypothetical protein
MAIICSLEPEPQRIPALLRHILDLDIQLTLFDRLHDGADGVRQLFPFGDLNGCHVRLQL